jgi:hypothetical protein
MRRVRPRTRDRPSYYSRPSDRPRPSPSLVGRCLLGIHWRWLKCFHLRRPTSRNKLRFPRSVRQPRPGRPVGFPARATSRYASRQASLSYFTQRGHSTRTPLVSHCCETIFVTERLVRVRSHLSPRWNLSVLPLFPRLAPWAVFLCRFAAWAHGFCLPCLALVAFGSFRPSPYRGMGRTLCRLFRLTADGCMISAVFEQ